jgi:hypothetical protein
VLPSSGLRQAKRHAKEIKEDVEVTSLTVDELVQKEKILSNQLKQVRAEMKATGIATANLGSTMLDVMSMATLARVTVRDLMELGEGGLPNMLNMLTSAILLMSRLNLAMQTAGLGAISIGGAVVSGGSLAALSVGLAAIIAAAEFNAQSAAGRGTSGRRISSSSRSDAARRLGVLQ